MNNKVYFVLSIIFIIALLSIVIFDGFAKYILTGVSSLSLFSLFVTFIIDQVKLAIKFAYDKQKLAYDISVNSNLSYDIHKKYLKFCEEYISKIYVISEKLIQEGDTEEALEYASALYNIRKENSLYIPEHVHDELYNFEYALRKIGAEVQFQKATINSDDCDERRSKSIKKSIKLLSQLVDLNNKDEDRTIKNREEIISYIRKTVGINRIVQLKDDILLNEK